MSSIYIAISAENQVAIIEKDENDVIISKVNKYISTRAGSEETTYTTDGLIRIAVQIHKTPEMREEFQEEINAIGWTLYHKGNDSKPTRDEIVLALRLLTKKWMIRCAKDSSCMPEPSREMQKDANIKKVLIKYQQMQEEINAYKLSNPSK